MGDSIIDTKRLYSSMSLLKNFKPKDDLPDPMDPYQQSLPPRVIATANSEVAKTM